MTKEKRVEREWFTTYFPVQVLDLTTIIPRWTDQECVDYLYRVSGCRKDTVPLVMAWDANRRPSLIDGFQRMRAQYLMMIGKLPIDADNWEEDTFTSFWQQEDGWDNEGWQDEDVSDDKLGCNPGPRVMGWGYGQSPGFQWISLRDHSREDLAEARLHYNGGNLPLHDPETAYLAACEWASRYQSERNPPLLTFKHADATSSTYCHMAGPGRFRGNLILGFREDGLFFGYEGEDTHTLSRTEPTFDALVSLVQGR